VTWTYGLAQARSQLASAGLGAPVWVIQSNDDTPSGTAPATADLNAFFDDAGAYASLWELPASSETAKRDQLSQLHWSDAP